MIHRLLNTFCRCRRDIHFKSTFDNNRNQKQANSVLKIKLFDMPPAILQRVPNMNILTISMIILKVNLQTRITYEIHFKVPGLTIIMCHT